ncbi:toll/interleukin-1 receptor domain-containing protein [Enterococcus ureasiticus]|uniref:toll/interleukin-1 receptor domain-containing protein n=1 Tax=Enterococcus ureasiticus TaxID=903984 RepID=UPI0030FAB4D8
MKLLLGGIKMGRKVFVSHCCKDKDYADVFVHLLKKFGFREEDIFYSSSPDTGVDNGELIFDRLKRELEGHPIVLYFLSENYYHSVPCLNEMGASWMMSEDHYPIALPNFSPNDITGAINSDRLALLLKKNFDEMKLFYLINQLCDKAGVSIPSLVDYHKEDYIRPAYEKLEELIQKEEYLFPDKSGIFETILIEEREVKGKRKETHECFGLPKVIAPEYLGLDNLMGDESHWLFFFKSEITYKKNDRVRFRLNKKQPGKTLDFEDIENCRNIYVSYLEKVE